MNNAQPINFLKTKISKEAFTLLEVMIAICIIAIAFVSLLGLQARSLSRATEARFILESSLLAAEKIAEFDGGARALISDNGTFENTTPEYSWESKVEEFTLDDQTVPPSPSPLKMVRLEVSISLKDTPYKYTIVSYNSASSEEIE